MLRTAQDLRSDACREAKDCSGFLQGAAAERQAIGGHEGNPLSNISSKLGTAAKGAVVVSSTSGNKLKNQSECLTRIGFL